MTPHRPSRRRTPRERGEALIHRARIHPDQMPQIAVERDEIALSRLCVAGRDDWLVILWLAMPGGTTLRLQSRGPDRDAALSTLQGDLAASTREPAR